MIDQDGRGFFGYSGEQSFNPSYWGPRAKQSYLRLVKAMVSRYRDDRSIIAWQFFYVTPKMERERADTQQERTVSAEQASPGSDAAIPSTTTSDTATPSATAGDQPASREEALQCGDDTGVRLAHRLGLQAPASAHVPDVG